MGHDRGGITSAGVATCAVGVGSGAAGFGAFHLAFVPAGGGLDGSEPGEQQVKRADDTVAFIADVPHMCAKFGQTCGSQKLGAYKVVFSIKKDCRIEAVTIWRTVRCSVPAFGGVD